MRSAKLTVAWLAILFVTTRIQRSAGRREALRIQRSNSTNLRRLRREPLRVLAASLIWTDTLQWWPFVVLFAGIAAPAERRMGWWRWLLVGAAAHVVGTYVSQAYLRREIRTGRAPRRLVDARDVGVSYFLLGVAGALTGYVEKRRPVHQAAALVALGAHTAAHPTFTEVGHLTAFLVGLAVTPALPDRDAKPFPQRLSFRRHESATMRGRDLLHRHSR